jgi:hypothetical protein
LLTQLIQEIAINVDPRFETPKTVIILMVCPFVIGVVLYLYFGLVIGWILSNGYKHLDSKGDDNRFMDIDLILPHSKFVKKVYESEGKSFSGILLSNYYFIITFTFNGDVDMEW